MIYLTIYGREVFWALVVVFLFIFGKKKGKKTAVLIIIIMIILIPIGSLSKQVIERPRPVIPESDFLIAADSEYAFPSGHAIMVSAGAVISLTLYRNSNLELVISTLLMTEAAMVCFSRIYVGGHYPLDVLAGILLGTGVSFLFIWKQKSILTLLCQLNRKIVQFVKL